MHHHVPFRMPCTKRPHTLLALVLLLSFSLASASPVFAPLGEGGGDERDGEPPVLRMHLSSTVNTFFDQATLVFADGTPAFDIQDAPKFVFAHPQAPQIAVRSVDGVNLAIDFFGTYATSITIPVLLNAAITGTYTVTGEMSGVHPLSCLRIEDLATGAIVPFGHGMSYSFEMQADDDPTAPRLLLHASTPLAVRVLDITCNGAADASARVDVGTEPVDLSWAMEGYALQTLSGVTGEVVLSGLSAGDYIVEFAMPGGCGMLLDGFTVTEPEVLQVDLVGEIPASCPNSTDGVVEFATSGGEAPYYQLWSTGATGPILVAGPGTYAVEVGDARGCSRLLTDVVIGAGEGPVAGIAAESSVLVNTPVSFASTSALADGLSWDFGDGTVSSEEAPVHTYALPGVYAVTLVVTYGECGDTASTEVAVEQNVGLTSLNEGAALNAWATAEHIMLVHDLDGPFHVELLDANGRLHRTFNSTAGEGSVRLPAGGLSDGLWFVRVTHAGAQRTLRVPLVR
jgi:hypothetical protein